MGALAGGIIGGLGTYLASRQQADAQREASKTALTGYNYLSGSGQNQQFQANGTAANEAQSQLLGLAPVTSGTTNGFNNYLNSTGYKFNLQQGTDAIASQAATAGLLNSGGTAKGLMKYGQDLGGQYFNNYLGQLGGVAQAGQAAIFAPANAAASGAGYASQAIADAGTSRGQATQSLFDIGKTVATDPGISAKWHL
jgi:hypothetical protein